MEGHLVRMLTQDMYIRGIQVILNSDHMQASTQFPSICYRQENAATLWEYEKSHYNLLGSKQKSFLGYVPRVYTMVQFVLKDFGLVSNFPYDM